MTSVLYFFSTIVLRGVLFLLLVKGHCYSSDCLRRHDFNEYFDCFIVGWCGESTSLCEFFHLPWRKGPCKKDLLFPLSLSRLPPSLGLLSVILFPISCITPRSLPFFCPVWYITELLKNDDVFRDSREGKGAEPLRIRRERQEIVNHFGRVIDSDQSNSRGISYLILGTTVRRGKGQSALQRTKWIVGPLAKSCGCSRLGLPRTPLYSWDPNRGMCLKRRLANNSSSSFLFRYDDDDDSCCWMNIC